jgi:hypothetical protein
MVKPYAVALTMSDNRVANLPKDIRIESRNERGADRRVERHSESTNANRRRLEGGEKRSSTLERKPNDVAPTKSVSRVAKLPKDIRHENRNDRGADRVTNVPNDFRQENGKERRAERKSARRKSEGKNTKRIESKSENRSDEGRPPLKPLVAIPHRQPPKELHRAPNFFFADEKPDPPPQQYLEMDDEDQFELMHVTIIVYGLNGILCEREPIKKKRSKLTRRGEAPSYRFGDTSFAKSSFGGSTISSLEASAASVESALDIPTGTTMAVVSFRKSAFSSQTSFENFLPSVPLTLPNSTIGNKSRYVASWPSEKSQLTRDPTDIERSSFKITRCMQQAAFVPGESRATAAGAVSNYVHETLELRINLSRGTELIQLGTASIVISGDEEGEMQMHVPAKPIHHKPKSKKLGFKSKTAKTNKDGYFTSDPSRRYYLDDNATLRVGVQVIPQEALQVAKEREKLDVGLKQMLERIGDENLERGDHRRIKQFAIENFMPPHPALSPKRPMTPQSPPHSLLPFFCGAMMCAPSQPMPEPAVRDIPKEIIRTQSDDFRYQFGVNSLISSVSESTDGSVDSEEDT